MKVERWEEESDEEWTERLAEEIAVANNTETTQYFVETYPYNEDEVVINYVGEDGFTWKEHPEGPFTAIQILEWKNKAEKWDKNKDDYLSLNDKWIECEIKLEAIGDAFQIHYLTLHDCTWMDREKMLKALDETAEKVKALLSEFTTKGEDKDE